jgi:hypothetical protein
MRKDLSQPKKGNTYKIHPTEYWVDYLDGTRLAAHWNNTGGIEIEE